MNGVHVHARTVCRVCGKNEPHKLMRHNFHSIPMYCDVEGDQHSAE